MGMFSSGIRAVATTKILAAHKLKLMELLRFSAADLADHLQEQSYANPLLEVQNRPSCPRCGRAIERTGCPTCRAYRTTSRYDTPAYSHRGDEEAPDPTEWIQSPRSSYTSLAEQCGELPFSHTERTIADYLLGELDERGLLVGTVAEHAAVLNISVVIIESVRRQLLQLDPLGIAATSVRECLSVKVHALTPAPAWATAALRLLETEWEQMMGDLDFARAARALRLSQTQLLEVVRELTTLCPYPIQGLRDDERDAMPAVPDVRFEVAGTNETAIVAIEILEKERTSIQINPHYLQGHPDLNDAAKQQLALYRRDARFWQSAVEQRWRTMERVCRAIFEAQRPFFTSGNYCPTTLVPLTREQIAATLGMHPSTIGRAIEEKYAALPTGRVVPLRYFFDQNVPIRALLRRRITAEAHPMSDGDLCDYLARRGWSMSRRAAAYHREAANILPKKLRTRERLLHHPSTS